MYKMFKTITIIIVAICIHATVYTQATMMNNDPDANFKLAKELYQKEQFSLAYPLFKTLDQATEKTNIPVTIQLESKYYSIVCGLKLNDETAVAFAQHFIALQHHVPRVQMMAYHLGEYYYRQKDFTAALEYYDKSNIANLNNREIAEMKFHQAYAYFTMQQFDKAKPLFNAIRQIPSDPNYIDANYYYGFIAFYDKNYKDALSSFKIVESEPTYVKIVPYYVAQIYYFNGEKDKAIEYAQSALQKGGQYYEMQLKQLIGHAYFEKQEFEKALPYLENYVSRTDKVRREDLYELSYCYYETKQYNKAIIGFKELGGKEDSLAQNSMYMLADAYLKTNQKNSARNAFLFSALNNSNAIQQEISQFHYAKLSYELGFTNVALTELQKFIQSNPASPYNTEAKELLIAVLATTNQYKDALTLHKSLNSQSEITRRIYPQILYGRAVELINDQQIVQAEELLNEVIQVPYNSHQLPFVQFWKGEIAYRTNRFDSSVHYFLNYLKTPASNGEVNVANAKYTLGYAYLRQQDYAAALQQFSQVATTVSPTSTSIEQDAFVRSADCYFMLKNYTKALQMYETVISSSLQGGDYALYQKAIISGAYNQYNEKLAVLQSLPQRYPSSNLIPDVNMEIANTYISNENFQQAISPLNTIVNNSKAEGLKPQAHLKLGVVYFNLNNNVEALHSFKKLVSSYPNSQESDAAIEYIRNIFIEDQKPAEFVSFMKQNGKAISFSEEDSLSYVAAIIRYNNQDFDNALKGFENYIAQYASGKYIIDANYNAANIYNGRKDYQNAVKYYAAVIAKAPNKYAEQSVLQAARISYFELKDYAASEQYFTQLKNSSIQSENKLEAMRGLLRTQYKLMKWPEAVQNAQELLQQKGIATDDKMMANMVIAKSYQINNQLEEAITAYCSVGMLGKSEFSAEASYRISEILLAQNKLPEAEKAGFEVINKAGSYDVWITKAYILLGEVYFRQKDYFNAEATLKSVVENAKDAILQKEAQDKLDIVIAEKNKNSKVEQ